MQKPNERTFRNANVPKSFKKPKGTVEKIDFGVHKTEIDRIWRGLPPTKLVEKWNEQGKSDQSRYYNPGTKLARINKIKILLGYSSNLVGYCSMCRSLNEYLLLQKVEGATILTRFCSEHVPDKI